MISAPPAVPSISFGLGSVRGQARRASCPQNGARVLVLLKQKTRLLARVDDTDKRWKISPTDLEERGYWKAYRKAFERALSATSTEDAPWFVVPADHKWYRNLVVAQHIVHALGDMDPRPPKVEEIDWTKLRRDVSES